MTTPVELVQEFYAALPSDCRQTAVGLRPDYVIAGLPHAA